MQSLVVVTYFFSKVIEEKPLVGWLATPLGKGRVNNRIAMATIKATDKQNLYF